MEPSRLIAEWTSAGALGTERAGWIALLDASSDPNPFYAPDILLAAEKHLHAGQPILCIAVRDSAAENRLCGLIPLSRPRMQDGMLGLAWSLYRNAYTCITAPLLTRGREREILGAALALLAASPGPKHLALPQIVEDGPAARALDALALDGHPLVEVDGQFRALVRSDLAPEAYSRAHWSKARRSKMRRKLDALRAMGEVAFHVAHGSSPEGRHLIETFLTLEASGWKGKAGTALASKPATRAFAIAAHGGHAAAPDVIFEMLTLDGRPLAMNVNLLCQDTGFTVKTAYDEAFAKQSPGLLLDGEAIRLACAGGEITTLDSCAAPGHPLDDIWKERQRIQFMLIGAEAGKGRTLTGLYARWLGFARRMIAKRHAKAYTTRRGAQ